MDTKTNAMQVELADKEVIMRRVINAPPELVFDAFTKAEHLEIWFGPHGFETTARTDPRPGGELRIVMHATDALPPEFRGDYPMSGTYREVLRPSKLVFTNELNEHSEEWKAQLKEKCGTQSDDALKSTATVTFEDLGGKTLVTLRSAFASNAIRDGYIKQGMNEGWGQSFERLESHVSKGN